MKKYKLSDISNHKEYAGKVKRLAVALVNHGYEREEAEAFISSARGILDDNREGLGQWFRENLPKLEDRPDLKVICEECACCLGGSREAAALKIYAEESDLHSRIIRLLKTPLIVGFGGYLIDDKNFGVLFFPNDREYFMCSCLKYAPGKLTTPMPESYCYCCGGHLKHHIQKALGREVEVNLKTSSLTTCGKEGCTFIVTVKDEI